MHYEYIDSAKSYQDWGACNDSAYETHREIMLMQFTGLHDKNGKEIYEGDVLKHDIWGVTEVFWDIPGSCFRCRGDDLDVKLSNHQLKRTKVVGSVYQNPELLNK